MKAVMFDRFGGVETLALRDTPDPAPAAGEIVVETRAISLNLIDSKVRSGAMGPLVSKKFPKTTGADFAGIVSAVGERAGGLKVGDAVFGAVDPLRGGAYAERVSAPASAVAKKPESLSFETAAAIPIAGLAALYSIRDLGKARPGAKALIHGASGGVGLYAVAIAKALGMHVTAVAGAGGEIVREAKADVVVDYRRKGELPPGPYDIILNASGKLPFSLARSQLAPRGVLVEPSPTIPVFIGSKIANLFRGRKHAVLQTVPRTADLEELARLAASGAITPRVANTFSFSEFMEAYRMLESGGVVGKIVVNR